MENEALKAVKALHMEISCHLTVANMEAEDFEDAMYFLNCASDQNLDSFSKLRYLRAAVVFFCACMDAWVARKTETVLIKNENELNDDEKKLLCVLRTPGQEIPGQGVMWKVLAKYSQLSDEQKRTMKSLYKKWQPIKEYRDSFIHYAQRNFPEHYDDAAIMTLICEAPKYIGQAIGVCDDLKTYSWYRNAMS